MVQVHRPTSMVRLIKILVLKALGLSLGVNQMWTKKNDHSPKSECADFFNTCPKMAVLKKKLKFEHSLVLSWASLVFTFC